jgi:hypothetical protein
LARKKKTITMDFWEKTRKKKTMALRALEKTMKKAIVATPLWPSVGVKLNTSKVGDLESSWTPECLEFDSKVQNTSH